MSFESVCTSSCHEHTLELLRVRVAIFAEVFGISVVASDQNASLKLAEQRKKRQLTESHKNIKTEI